MSTTTHVFSALKVTVVHGKIIVSRIESCSTAMSHERRTVRVWKDHYQSQKSREPEILATRSQVLMAVHCRTCLTLNCEDLSSSRPSGSWLPLSEMEAFRHSVVMVVVEEDELAFDAHNSWGSLNKPH